MGKIAAFYTMPHPPIIIPEIGRGEEEKIRRTSDACHKISKEIKKIRPDTIVIVTPHGPLFSDAIAISGGESISGNLKKFNAENIEIDLKIDTILTDKIIANAKKEKISVLKINDSVAKKYKINYELDHGSMVPLYFINQQYSNFKIVHITYGMLPKLQLYKFGMCIKDAIMDSDINAVFIASGDLSHRLIKDGPYEYSPYGEKFDNEILALLSKGDVYGVFNMDYQTVEKASECGLRSYYIMLGAMDGNEFTGELLSYEGTFGVGYSVMKFNLGNSVDSMYTYLLDDKKQKLNNKIDNHNPYVRLARESLTYYLLYGYYMDVPDYVTDEMKKLKRGVFVTLKKEGQLRGCIGTTVPVMENVAKEIIRNAVEAGEYDPRFNPVTEDEIDEIDFSVDILTEPVEAEKEELDVKKYGVIVRSGKKSGLLLPDLEGIDTVEQQLKIVLQKAEISPDENYEIKKFEIIRYI